MEDSVVGRLCALIASTRQSALGEVALDTPLGDRGVGLDSLDLFHLLVACEREFSVTFDPGLDLTPDALTTVGSLAELIHAKRQG
jgi:acyl carrier protein